MLESLLPEPNGSLSMTIPSLSLAKTMGSSSVRGAHEKSSADKKAILDLWVL